MTYKPSLEELKIDANRYRTVPVSCEIFSDIRTPIAVLKTLKERSTKCFLLESVEGGDKWGRYSFLGYDPKLEISLLDGDLTVTAGIKTTRRVSDPNAALREILAQYRSPRLSFLPPFTGGFVGYFAYEYYRYYEKIALTATGGANVPDLYLMLFDKIIAFDNLRQKMVFIVHIATDRLEENYRRAVTELSHMVQVVVNAPYRPAEKGTVTGPFTAQFTAEQYADAVQQAKRYVREGDVFQVVPSCLKSAPFEGSLLNAYRNLRTTNPSPYMFYLDCDTLELTGASPETLLKKEGELVSTFPIAGTMPRGASDEEDAELAEKLASDEKERAEHSMLVDLGRNDLGKVCRTGTVRVTDFMKINRFSHVMHLTSTVSGILKEHCDGLDALRATLPAGTLSGAPKRRACQIIDELEGVRRGIYGGSIGYIDFAGNLDMCIAIRMAVLKDGRVYVRSGGGVVDGSDPDSEYRETVHKAAAVVEALLGADEVYD